jgi:HemY protein
MLWSLLKIVIFVAIAAALAYGASILLETPGEVRLALGNREFFLSPIGFTIALALMLIAAIVLLKIIGFLVALVRFVLGDETAISRYFRGNRERRGFEALTDGMLALAAGDATVAKRKAVKAEKLLNRPEITRLLAAQAAESAGDRPAALAAYKSMIPDARTRFAGVQGALKLKLEAGEEDLALALADKAFAMRPDNSAVLRTRFELQSKTENWTGARETLNASMHARLLPRDVGTRRDAVLSLADARKALEAGDTARGHEAAKQANKLAPTLVPAAALAARAHLAAGAKRKAVKVLTTAWSAGPHPDLAAAFAEIEPGESPAERRRRFEALIAAAPEHAESKLTAAELALADEDFPGARKALGDLAEREPTTRSLALMAAIERGLGSPEAVVRGFLAKALSASRGPQWTCGKCNHIHANWHPVCENCGAFDTLDWKAAPAGEDAGLASSAMLPLIIGNLGDGTRTAHDAPRDHGTVEEAEEIADRPA